MKRMTPKGVRRIVMALFALGAFLALTGAFSESSPLTVGGTVILLCAIVVHFSFYRCPYCGKFLDRSAGDFCPHCGKKISQ